MASAFVNDCGQRQTSNFTDGLKELTYDPDISYLSQTVTSNFKTVSSTLQSESGCVASHWLCCHWLNNKYLVSTQNHE